MMRTTDYGTLIASADVDPRIRPLQFLAPPDCQPGYLRVAPFCEWLLGQLDARQDRPLMVEHVAEYGGIWTGVLGTDWRFAPYRREAAPELTND